MKLSSYTHVSIPGDGNCFFRSIVEYLHLDENLKDKKTHSSLSGSKKNKKADQLRKECVQWLRKNIHFKTPY